MSARSGWSAGVIAAVVMLSACNGRPSAVEQATEIALAAGEVGASGGGAGPNVLVFEENHASVLGQLEQALMLVRLRKGDNLAAIVVEGMAPGEEPADPTYGSALLQSEQAREEAAFSVLQQGEISAAEFMYLAYGTRLVPGERSDTYAPQEGDNAIDSLCGAMAQIAYAGLASRFEYDSTGAPAFVAGLEARQAEEAAAAAAVEQYAGALASFSADQCESGVPRAPDNSAALSAAQNYFRAHSATLRWIVKEDATLLPTFERHCGERVDVMTVGLDEETAEVQDVLARLDALPSDSGAAQVRGDVSIFLTFLEARSAASAAMLDAINGYAPEARDKTIVVIVGAAHTEQMVNGLAGRGRSYAVLRGASLDTAFAADFSGGEFGRKNRSLPVQDDPLGCALQAAAPLKKPPLVINTAWIRPELEINSLLDRLGDAVFAEDDPIARAAALEQVRAQVAASGGDPPWRGDQVWLESDSMQFVPQGSEDDADSVLVRAHVGDQSVWARLYAASSVEASTSQRSIEERLVAAIDARRERDASKDRSGEAQDSTAMVDDKVGERRGGASSVAGDPVRLIGLERRRLCTTSAPSAAQAIAMTRIRRTSAI